MGSFFRHRVRQPVHILTLVGCGVLSLVLPLCLQWVWPMLLEPIELWSIDQRFRFRPLLPVAPDALTEKSPNLVAIDYDDQAARTYELGRWPWDRRVHAQVLDWLREGEARSVMIDLVFEFPSRDSDEDQALIQATRQADNVVLPVVLLNGREKALPLTNDQPASPNTISVNIQGQGKLPEAQEVLSPFPPLDQTAAYLGHIQRTTDMDGVLRRVPLVFSFKGGVVPAFSLAAAFKHLQVDPSTIQVRLGETLQFHSSELGQIVIPIDDQGRTWINFAGPWGTRFFHFPYSWLKDNLGGDDRQAKLKAWFKDHSVVIGNLTTGSSDQGAIPYERNFPFSEMHLHLLNMIFTKQFLRDANATETAAAFILPIVMLSASAFIAGPIVILAIGFLLLVIYLLILQLTFTYSGLLLPAVTPVGTLILGLILLLTARYFLVDRERWRFLSILGSCLPPKTVQVISETPSRIPDLLKGRRRELSILFADVKGFSTWSTEVDPTEVQTVLKDYLHAMTLIIRHHGGTLDKYMGDGIMAFFGDAEPDDGGPEEEEIRVRRQVGNAIRASVAMQQKMAELNQSWQSRNLRTHQIRIGINTGIVMIGNLGTEYLWDYTVIGSDVNMAQRLESAADPGGVLLSPHTAELAIKEETLPPDLPRKEATLKGIGLHKNLCAISPDLIANWPNNPRVK